MCCVTCAAFVGEELFATTGKEPYPVSEKFPRSAELESCVWIDSGSYLYFA